MKLSEEIEKFAIKLLQSEQAKRSPEMVRAIAELVSKIRIH